MRQLTFIFILITTFSFGQENTSTIKDQAEQTAKALLTDDYETLIKFTYPKLLELAGGRDEMISTIKKFKLKMAQQGITFERVTFGTPTETVKAGKEIHCLLPQTLYLKVPNGRMKNETQLLAISKDNGLNWTFIDTANLDNDKVKIVLPDYNFDLPLPPKTQPVFIPD